MIFTKNTIYTIKIASGDEIVTRVVDFDQDTITIEHPLIVIPSQQGIQLIFALFTADPKESITLNKSNCVLVAPAREEVQDSFIEASTGIKPVRNQILMG